MGDVKVVERASRDGGVVGRMVSDGENLLGRDLARPRAGLGRGRHVRLDIYESSARLPCDVSEPKGQERLGSLQRLSLAFLVDAEHHRIVSELRWSPTISRTFSAKNGSVESLKCFYR